MKKLIVISLFIVLSTALFAQTEDNNQPIWVVDCPTAGLLNRGSFLTGLYTYNDGGIMGLLEVGVTNRIMFGISYGGKNIIGAGSVDWNPQAGVNIRYRLINEYLTFPAVSIGYDNQGRGAYIDSLNRYSEKSKGLFLAVSKSFRFIGTFALHGGLNYSFERDDSDKDLNGYLGMEKSINEELGMFVEYDLAMNDNTGRSIGDGKGYLNAGLRWTMQSKFYIDFIWKNILENNKYHHQSGRVIRMSYIEYF
jgi:hypothetical protein